VDAAIDGARSIRLKSAQIDAETHFFVSTGRSWSYRLTSSFPSLINRSRSQSMPSGFRRSNSLPLAQLGSPSLDNTVLTTVAQDKLDMLRNSSILDRILYRSKMSFSFSRIRWRRSKISYFLCKAM
jgi:hypothetical protein